MNEADQKFAAAARDWLNIVADENEAEARMTNVSDALDALRKRRVELEDALGQFVGMHCRVRAAACGRWTVLVESGSEPLSKYVRRIPTIKAGVDAP